MIDRMIVTIPDNLIYSIDRGNFDRKMAVSNVVFILSQHINDETADFLETEFFQQLHEECCIAHIAKWCRDVYVLKQLIGSEHSIKNYAIDTITGKAQVILNG